MPQPEPRECSNPADFRVYLHTGVCTAKAKERHHRDLWDTEVAHIQTGLWGQEQPLLALTEAEHPKQSGLRARPDGHSPHPSLYQELPEAPVEQLQPVQGCQGCEREETHPRRAEPAHSSLPMRDRTGPERAVQPRGRGQSLVHTCFWLRPLQLHVPLRWALTAHHKERHDLCSHRIQLSHQSHQAHAGWTGMLPHKDTSPLTVPGNSFLIFIETVSVKHSEKSKEFILFERRRKNPGTTIKQK